MLNGCDRPPPATATPPPAAPGARPDAAQVPAPQNCQPRLQAFYRWYVGHRDSIEALRYCLVDLELSPGAAPQPYAVDSTKQRAYLRYLAGSGFFAPAFLERLNRSLAQKGAYLRAHPQVDGLPAGFEADDVLFTQDLDLAPAAFRYVPTATGWRVDNGENLVEFTFDAQCHIMATAFAGRSPQI